MEPKVGLEPWEEYLKEAIDSDPLLPGYDELGEDWTEEVVITFMEWAQKMVHTNS